MFMDKKIKLDGTWVHGIYKLTIKGNACEGFYNGSCYGKGTIIYDNYTFTLTSSHARLIFMWIPFIQQVKGEYFLTKGKLTVSKLDGKYSGFNGTWINKSGGN
jgi:hypothetical protein